MGGGIRSKIAQNLTKLYFQRLITKTELYKVSSKVSDAMRPHSFKSRSLTNARNAPYNKKNMEGGVRSKIAQI